MEEITEVNRNIKIKFHAFKCDVCGATICEVQEDPMTGAYVLPEENMLYFSTKSTYNNEHEFTRYQKMCLCDKCMKIKEDEIDDAIRALGFKHSDVSIRDYGKY